MSINSTTGKTFEQLQSMGAKTAPVSTNAPIKTSVPPVVQSSQSKTGGLTLQQLIAQQHSTPSTPETATTAQDTGFLSGHPILKGISDLVGTTGLGKGISQSIFLNFTPEGKQALSNLSSGKITQQQFNDITGGPIASNKEVLGSAAQVALNVGLAGSGSTGAGTTGSLVKAALPGAVETGVGQAAKRVATKAATGFLGGGALGATQGLSDNKSLGESLKQGLVTGTIGSILGGGAQGVSELVRGLTAPQLTQKIYDTGIGVSKKVAQSGRSPSTQLIKDGVVGTAKTIYDRAQNTIDDVSPKINSILQKSTKTVSADKVFSSLAEGLNKSVGNTGEGSIGAAEMKQIIQSSIPQVRTLMDKAQLTLSETNQLRQIMDHTLGDRAFNGATLPFKKDALYDASNSLRSLVQTLAPETKDLFKQYSTSIGTIKALNNELSKPHVMRHMISLLSAAGGGPLGVAAGAVNEGARTTVAKTATAVGLDKVRRVLESADGNLKFQLLKKLGGMGVLNTIKKINP